MDNYSTKIRPTLYIVLGVLLSFMVVQKIIVGEVALDFFDYMQMVLGPVAVILGVMMLRKK